MSELKSVESWILPTGAALACVAVGAGAFGAHALRDVLTPERLEVWRTAANYQLLSGIGLVALSGARVGGVGPKLVAAGALVFAGSLYALCLLDLGVLGAVTPFGGAMMIAGWATITVGGIRRSRANT